MSVMKRISYILIGMIIVGAVSLIYMAQTANCGKNSLPTHEDCLDCHDEVEGMHNITYDSLLSKSIHQDLECVDCHTAITELPHDEKLPKVDCGECHSDVAETYTQHGRLPVGAKDVPTCADCHGKHNILPPSDRYSSVNSHNLPKTCGKCHEDLNLVKRHNILFQNPVQLYKTSVHGQATSEGITAAATCTDCHSAGGTAHKILPPNNPESPIAHFNIPHTCGKCHKSIEDDYWQGIHGQLASEGEVDSPVCTDCHGEHGILSPKDPRSPVSPARIAEATCSPCHESARLNQKYGIPTGRLKSYIDSYHGLKSESGDLKVANCASCHGAHLILPHTDPRSTIYPDNLPKTCGKCHPGISKELADTPIHGDGGVSQTKAAKIVAKIYIILIAVVIGFMVIHWLIDLRKKISELLRKSIVKRMTYSEVWQHTFLMVSFTVLVITGFSLRFSQSWWATMLFGWDGGFVVRGIIHRVAGSVLIFTAIWHLFHLTTDRGRQFIVEISPNKNDLFQLIQKVKYNLGLADTPPKFGRFCYIAKAEYWALIWGTIIMASTGLLLWFDNLAIKVFPKGFLDVVLVIHYYEAWLATLAILVWHFYTTIFNPEVYPMNPSWINGRMPVEMYEHEHPLDAIEKRAELTVDHPADEKQKEEDIPQDIPREPEEGTDKEE